MITDLDEPSALDPKRVGAKASALALARQAGLPVLPGFVVDAAASLRHMELGASTLADRGSGGARLAVSSQPIPEGERIAAAGGELSLTLAVRSSSPLETDGIWAGAFTSYLGIEPGELPKAVAGCWASAFSVDSLERQRQAEIEPGSVSMAVLVQPFVESLVAGVAEIGPDGTLRVEAVAGPPARLLQGWERGAAAVRPPGHRWEGVAGIDLVGEETLDELGAALAQASERFGFTRCEWGVADAIWIFQLGTVPEPRPLVGSDVADPMAAVVLEQGARHQGVPAAPGVGIGRLYPVARADGQAPPRGTVICAPTALPQLSQLIWEAAGLVTGRGSPVAHVFESARSLHVPAVTGVDLEPDPDMIVVVDGFTGVVAVLPAQMRTPGS